MFDCEVVSALPNITFAVDSFSLDLMPHEYIVTVSIQLLAYISIIIIVYSHECMEPANCLMLSWTKLITPCTHAQ